MRQEHVRAHAGLVRCGACRGIFDARLNIIDGTLEPLDDALDDGGSPATILAGVPASPHAPVADAPVSESGPPTRQVEGSELSPSILQDLRAGKKVEIGSKKAEKLAEPTSKEDSSNEAEARYDWRKPAKPLSRGQRAALGVCAFLLFIGLIANAAFWLRNEIASRFPATQPHLSAACGWIGCRVSPPKRSDAIGFIGSDLAADPAHKGLLIFTATMRNSSTSSVAFPHLVLTLEGMGGEPIARRVFAPEQYAPANASLQRGLDGNGDVEVKLYLDVSPAVPVGFKADHAYF